MAEREINITPANGSQQHTCIKHDCFFCYEMNRINQPKKELKFQKKSTYQHRKQREYLRLFEQYKQTG